MIRIDVYGMMVKEGFNRSVLCSTIGLIDLDRVEFMPIDAPFRNPALEALKNADDIRRYDYEAALIDSYFKRKSCNFRQFCNVF